MISKRECCRCVMTAAILVVVLGSSMAVSGRSDSHSISKLPVRMPGAMARRDNMYLCTSVELYEKEEYVVRFEPKASQDVAHHMLLFGCYSPGSKKKTWDCGAMEGMECQGKEKILFAWAKDAPAKDLPKGVAFKIGQSSSINYLVLQVHYKHKAPVGVKDYSGFILHTTRHRQPYLAGIFLLWSGNADIAPETNGVHTDIGCTYKEEAPIFAFAYRTHSHSLGRVISGYKVNGNNWTLLGKKNPQEPQAFYPMNKIVKISKGVTLAARCTYDAKGHHLTKHVQIGSTGEDEMCNFYIMYYRDASLPDIANELCSDMDMGGLAMDFPPDSSKLSITSKTLNRGSKKTATDAPVNTISIHKEDIPKHPNVLNEGYDLVQDWPNLGQDRLGEVTGVALDSSGNVLVFHRGRRTWNSNSFDDKYVFNGQHPIREYTVLTINPHNGSVIGRWGMNMFYLPHGITVDNKDNIWLTDVAMHQVLKYPARGGDIPMLSVGEMFVPGSDDAHFCQPTDVAVEWSGVFYVADGYCNSRIMKFSSKGKVLAKWEKSSGSLSLDIPHSLALDEITQRLYIADMENGRIQYVDTRTGRFGRPITKHQFGLIYAVDFNRHNRLLYAVNGNSLKSNLHVKGFTLRARDSFLINTWPGGKHLFSHPHDMVSSSDGNHLFVVETRPNKVLKLTKRTKQTTHATQTTVVNKEPMHGGIPENPTKEDTENSPLPSNHDSDTDTDTHTNSKESLPVNCSYEKETGPCRAAIQRWYYDINKHRCVQFIYGGCQGNENNFKSQKECHTNCASKGRSNHREKFNKQESGRVSETLLKKLSNKNDEDGKTNSSKNRPKLKPKVHDDWQNAAGEDEGEESNLHVWKNRNNTNTTMSTPHQIPKTQATNKQDMQAGMVPALIILSVLAVPIVFLLLISIVLRIRAYRRERKYQSNRSFDQEGLAVNRSLGWWSYLNCCSKRKYGFDKVNLAEFYSDSESDRI